MMVTETTATVVEEITTLDALERLRPEWGQLWARDPAATPFQSPQWLIPWWRHIGQGELWTLALRAGARAAHPGRLVGLLPFYVYTRPPHGTREVFPLGMATTDCLDALFAPGWKDCGMRAAWQHLEAQSHRWTLCDWAQLRLSSPLLADGTPAHWAQEVDEAEPCPSLRLPAKVEQLPACVPSSMMHNLRYYRRRAERLGSLRTEAASPDNLDELFDALLRLHRARWSSRDLPGVLGDGAVQRAHWDALPGLLSLGVLRLYALRLGRRIIAVLYGLADQVGPQRRFYYYLGGFDPEFVRLSPGTLAIGHAIEEAIREGIDTFDFLRGQEPYKYLWGATDMMLYRRRIWHAAVACQPAAMTRL